MMNGMSALEQHTKVLAFIERWKGHGDEKQETQCFWIDLLQNVLGVEDALGNTMFEYKTVGGGFIDVLCPEARFLVEQKVGAADVFLEIITQPFPGFVCIVPDSSNQATA